MANSDIEDTLSQQANSLMERVSAGDMDGAMKVIGQLNDTRDRTLYLEVGKLTRTLHDAIRNFHIDIDNKKSQEISTISDASDRLSYVVVKTNEAANRTLDLVEETMPLATTVKQEAHELKTAWERLRRREMDPSEFRELYKRIDRFFVDLESKSDQIYTNLSDILLTQDFQDLTGQVIKKVTTLITDVEVNLVKLVAMAGQVDKITGVDHGLDDPDKGHSQDMKGHGPQINTGSTKAADVVSNQDDVDDLLSSLGF
ncbi:MAG: protein phosphatase [unclassified Hahellaceae]|nr:protein phosphatase [Hahellaceae bacterium]|tara:strand:- start:47436 stop:48206 length:771 start_codon:yes stop_codon:yes gene_type:complete